ncbi:MAG: hypothetical protein JO362_02060 [Streptomycetaceae bacterium]|nr:hypothetical protein [Streptomycetaceae bacterium]
MRSTISRTVILAATATGILALGSVAANAAPYLSAPSVPSTIAHTLSSPTHTLPSPAVKHLPAVPGHTLSTLSTLTRHNPVERDNILRDLHKSEPGVQPAVQKLASHRISTHQIEHLRPAHIGKHEDKDFTKNLPSAPSTPTLPSAPSLPSAPNTPSLPSTSSTPSTPTLPTFMA